MKIVDNYNTKGYNCSANFLHLNWNLESYQKSDCLIGNKPNPRYLICYTRKSIDINDVRYIYPELINVKDFKQQYLSFNKEEKWILDELTRVFCSKGCKALADNSTSYLGYLLDGLKKYFLDNMGCHLTELDKDYGEGEQKVIKEIFFPEHPFFDFNSLDYVKKHERTFRKWIFLFYIKLGYLIKIEMEKHNISENDVFENNIQKCDLKFLLRCCKNIDESNEKYGDGTLHFSRKIFNELINDKVSFFK